MMLKVVKARLVVLPLVALFFLLGGGAAAAAPDCHIESITQTQSKSAQSHSHSESHHSHAHEVTSVAVPNTQVMLLSVGGSLKNEICVAIGFIVLLLFRFLRVTKSLFAVRPLSRPRYLLPFLLSKNLRYLNLTHLQLGIIRI